MSGSDPNAQQDTSAYAMLDFDAESGTAHASFRQYSDTQGRWMSPDPYAGSYNVNDPQSMNRYTGEQSAGLHRCGRDDAEALLYDGYQTYQAYSRCMAGVDE